MCTLSQKDAVNEYFVHTENGWRDWFHRQKVTPTPSDTHDAPSPTVDNGDSTRELIEAQEEIAKLNLMIQECSLKMHQHEKENEQHKIRVSELLSEIEEAEFHNKIYQFVITNRDQQIKELQSQLTVKS